MTDLRQQALNAAHARSRERFLALYYIALGDCATRVAARTGRHPQTVMEWLGEPAGLECTACNSALARGEQVEVGSGYV